MTDIRLRLLRFWLLFFCTLTVLCPTAEARPRSLSLKFQSSSACATEAKFDEALDALLKGWQGQSAAQFSISISNSDPLEIVLKVTDDGQMFNRMVVIDNCDLAPRVAALLVALTLDPATLANMSDTAALDALSKGEKAPTAADGASPPAPDEGPGTSGDASEDVTKESAPREADAAHETLRSHADHSIAFWMNTILMVLPRLGFGPAVEYGWRRHPIAPLVDGRFSFSSNERITSGEASAAMRLWLFSAHAGAELQVASERWIFAPRLGVGIHLFVAKTIDFPNDFRDVQSVFSPWTGGVVRFRINDAAGLMAVANADWLVSNSTYRLQRGEIVHETGHFLLQVGVGFFHFF